MMVESSTELVVQVEALQNMDGEQLAVELSGPLAPGVLKPVEDSAYVHVIMPVRTPS